MQMILFFEHSLPWHRYSIHDSERLKGEQPTKVEEDICRPYV